MNRRKRVSKSKAVKEIKGRDKGYETRRSTRKKRGRHGREKERTEEDTATQGHDSERQRRLRGNQDGCKR